MLPSQEGTKAPNTGCDNGCPVDTTNRAVTAAYIHQAPETKEAGKQRYFGLRSRMFRQLMKEGLWADFLTRAPAYLAAD